MRVIEEAAQSIAQSTSLVITAGAGMGVDSGLPDFRGPEGFWRAYPALRGHSFQEMANPKWFDSDPHRAWGFYGHRLNLYRRTKPHVGFNVLKKWSSIRKHFIFTSNVDGAFQKSGFSTNVVAECHGSIHHMQYVHSRYGEGVWSANETKVSVNSSDLRAEDPLPMRNGHLLRPNILMFGDWSWISRRTVQQEQRMEHWLQSDIDWERAVVVELGAGRTVPTVRMCSEQLQRSGAILVRINPRDSEGPMGTLSIPMGAKEGLLAIEALL
jgi:NAD-dependent SIR2 family protein deacetylase